MFFYNDIMLNVVPHFGINLKGQDHNYIWVNILQTEKHQRAAQPQNMHCEKKHDECRVYVGERRGLWPVHHSGILL